MDVRDWLVIGFVAAIQAAATIFLFKHPDTMNFATWGTVCATVTAAYHWVFVKDQKMPDAL